MATEKRLIDANAPIKKLEERRNLFIDAWQGFAYLSPSDKARVDEIDTCIAEIINAPTVDAVEVVRIEEVKQEILQQMDMFIAEYNRIGFYGKSDVMDIARRLVNAALNELCSNCGAKMDGDGDG